MNYICLRILPLLCTASHGLKSTGIADQSFGDGLFNILQAKYDPATAAINAGIPIPIPTPSSMLSSSSNPLDAGVVLLVAPVSDGIALAP